jgi:hypothetical protein
MPYWAHPQNQTLTRSACRCFVFHARKTPGFEGFWWFCAEFIGEEFRFNLNELIISQYNFSFQLSLAGGAPQFQIYFLNGQHSGKSHEERWILCINWTRW